MSHDTGGSSSSCCMPPNAPGSPWRSTLISAICRAFLVTGSGAERFGQLPRLAPPALAEEALRQFGTRHLAVAAGAVHEVLVVGCPFRLLTCRPLRCLALVALALAGLPLVLLLERTGQRGALPQRQLAELAVLV